MSSPFLLFLLACTTFAVATDSYSFSLDTLTTPYYGFRASVGERTFKVEVIGLVEVTEDLTALIASVSKKRAPQHGLGFNLGSAKTNEAAPLSWAGESFETEDGIIVYQDTFQDFAGIKWTSEGGRGEHTVSGWTSQGTLIQFSTFKTYWPPTSSAPNVGQFARINTQIGTTGNYQGYTTKSRNNATNVAIVYRAQEIDTAVLNSKGQSKVWRPVHLDMYLHGGYTPAVSLGTYYVLNNPHINADSTETLLISELKNSLLPGPNGLFFEVLLHNLPHPEYPTLVHDGTNPVALGTTPNFYFLTPDTIPSWTSYP